ncbi:uncharacterized protein LOC100893448 [Strongylocentrotus purpuratus]|uniref:Uncharacterized protein n=1 Tax=Strongylocentrotus purpuratus TaxID=7668 RepID=A0A7M7GGJ7_STRPU|nr:uncharacterized protein LOC100893448 [Strongylocentrotus purpuratus]
MPLRDSRTMQGMSYRQSPAETLSGCRHLRCKAFLVTVLGVLLVASFPATYSSAMLIVGVFLILLGSALAFMYYVARDLGKENTAAGQGVNRSWNRIRRQRLQRRRRRNSATRRSANTNPTSGEHDHEDTAPPPAYETSISVEELMRCPEPSGWTFLPSDPPPVYFPPITALDSNHSHTATDDHPETDQSQSALPIYSISRELSYTLPTYEQALDETHTHGAMNENDDDNGTRLSNQDTVVVELDDDHEIDTVQPTFLVCETSVSNSDSIQQLLNIGSAQGYRESVDTITQVLI